MQQDDRIFAVVGACVVAAVALVAAIMWVVSGMTVDAPERATVMITDRPIPTPEASLGTDPQIVEASFDGRRGASPGFQKNTRCGLAAITE